MATFSFLQQCQRCRSTLREVPHSMSKRSVLNLWLKNTNRKFSCSHHTCKSPWSARIFVLRLSNYMCGHCIIKSDMMTEDLCLELHMEQLYTTYAYIVGQAIAHGHMKNTTAVGPFIPTKFFFFLKAMPTKLRYTVDETQEGTKKRETTNMINQSQ